MDLEWKKIQNVRGNGVEIFSMFYVFQIWDNLKKGMVFNIVFRACNYVINKISIYRELRILCTKLGAPCR